MVYRRRLLAVVGTATTAAVAGCLDTVGGGQSNEPTEVMEPTDGSPTTDATGTTLAVTPASFSDVDPSEPVAVISEPLGGLLRTATTTDGAATVVATLAEWESRPPALASLDTANIQFEDGRGSGGRYSLALRWGPVYDYAFEVEAVPESEVPAGETPIVVDEQPSDVRGELVDAIQSGTASLSPRSEAYFVLVSADEEATNETMPVAYLRYEGEYYTVTQRASTPVPTDELYLRLRASRKGDVDDSLVTLAVPTVSDAVKRAFEEAFRAWSAGESGYAVETVGDALSSFDARYDYVHTVADVFGFRIQS